MNVNWASSLGSTLIDNRGKEHGTNFILSGKIVLLYFSAHWCPPCRMFTPKLVNFYSKLKNNCEIVFVSRDRNQAQFQEYFNTMPWKAIPLSSPCIQQLAMQHRISSIPSLLVFNTDGTLITTNGRRCVEGDPSGLQFPWLHLPAEDTQLPFYLTPKFICVVIIIVFIYFAASERNNVSPFS